MLFSISPIFHSVCCRLLGCVRLFVAQANSGLGAVSGVVVTTRWRWRGVEDDDGSSDVRILLHSSFIPRLVVGSVFQAQHDHASMTITMCEAYTRILRYAPSSPRATSCKSSALEISNNPRPRRSHPGAPIPALSLPLSSSLFLFLSLSPFLSLLPLTQLRVPGAGGGGRQPRLQRRGRAGRPRARLQHQPALAGRGVRAAHVRGRHGRRQRRRGGREDASRRRRSKSLNTCFFFTQARVCTTGGTRRGAAPGGDCVDGTIVMVLVITGRALLVGRKGGRFEATRLWTQHQGCMGIEIWWSNKGLAGSSARRDWNQCHGLSLCLSLVFRLVVFLRCCLFVFPGLFGGDWEDGWSLLARTIGTKIGGSW